MGLGIVINHALLDPELRGCGIQLTISPTDPLAYYLALLLTSTEPNIVCEYVREELDCETQVNAQSSRENE